MQQQTRSKNSNETLLFCYYHHHSISSSTSSMTSTGRPKGTCCAGQYCQHSNLELSPAHKCRVCGGITHVLCGDIGNGDDSLVCALCQHTKMTNVPASTQDIKDYQGSPPLGRGCPRSKPPRIKIGCHVKTTQNCIIFCPLQHKGFAFHQHNPIHTITMEQLSLETQPLATIFI